MPESNPVQSSFSGAASVASDTVSVSIVSHRQADLVAALLADLCMHCRPERVQVILTINIEEALPFQPADFAFDLVIIKNDAPKGFGANHNAAMRRAHGAFFCVLNPDIRLARDPFPPLLEKLHDPSVGVAAPLVLDPAGNVEASARKFPTPIGILKKALSGARELDYEIGTMPIFSDWVGGMFMLFRSATFGAVGGFDERYFLYYEDVDICWRMRQRNLRAALVPTVSVVHNARRRSHRDPRYLVWHLASMLRFFGTKVIGRRSRPHEYK